MDRETEIKELIEHIPLYSNYTSAAHLQISIPTNSLISPAKALEIVQNYAIKKGWSTENITIISKSGYISCENCKQSLHIHINIEGAAYCMNCEHHNSQRVPNAKVMVIEKKD